MLNPNNVMYVINKNLIHKTVFYYFFLNVEKIQ